MSDETEKNAPITLTQLMGEEGVRDIIDKLRSEAESKRQEWVGSPPLIMLAANVIETLQRTVEELKGDLNVANLRLAAKASTYGPAITPEQRAKIGAQLLPEGHAPNWPSKWIEESNAIFRELLGEQG